MLAAKFKVRKLLLSNLKEEGSKGKLGKLRERDTLMHNDKKFFIIEIAFVCYKLTVCAA